MPMARRQLTHTTAPQDHAYTNPASTPVRQQQHRRQLKPMAQMEMKTHAHTMTAPIRTSSKLKPGQDAQPQTYAPKSNPSVSPCKTKINTRIPDTSRTSLKGFTSRRRIQTHTSRLFRCFPYEHRTCRMPLKGSSEFRPF